jgi:aspartyl-tRNA(Asn)/glutamyl-tRNA(Gln) amidotransferase subunit A
MTDFDAIAADSLATLENKLRHCSMTSEELVHETVRAIDAHRAEGGVAYILVNAPDAIRRAQECDRMRRAGYVPSVIAGIPVSVTDAFDIAGEITTVASKTHAEMPPATTDAPVIARLRNAGAVLIGRTNMSEFALSCLGTNVHYGTPTHPMDSQRVVGGAACGLAISVAKGMAVAGVGADTQGSIRIPAAFCGLTAFKPSASRVSTVGVYPLSPTLDSIGSIGRCVDDCSIIDSVISGERREPAQLTLAGLRLAVTADYVLDALDATVECAFKRVLRLLEEAGAEIRWFEFPELQTLSQINESGGFVAVEAWYQHRQFVHGNAVHDYDPAVLDRLRQGEAVSAYDYLDMLSERQRLIQVAHTRLAGIDAWLMPTVSIVAPRLDELEINESEPGYYQREATVRRNTSVANFLDGCALTLPCHEAGDLPCGLSVVGLHGSDTTILRIGRAIETLLRA